MTFYHEELTHKIIGISFLVYNNVGWGYREQYYHSLMKKIFEKEKIKYISEKQIQLITSAEGEIIRRPDFYIEDKLIVELKVADRLVANNFLQVTEYLKALDQPLGLLILFSPQKVVPRRVLNLPSQQHNNLTN